MRTITFLCGNTSRSVVYVEYLSKIKNIKVDVILYGYKARSKSATLDEITSSYLTDELCLDLIDVNMDIKDVLNGLNYSFDEVKNNDVNGKEIINLLSSRDSEFIIFSGYGGQILAHDHFISNKRYINCHPGELPLERGSTTLYYSLLKNRDFTVTAFFMTSKIDEGIHILEMKYAQPNSIVNIDQYVDVHIRAETLRKSILKLLNNNDYKEDISFR